jgi:hypothetical protein
MIKIEITKDDPEYRGHTKFKKGMIGYITKETQAQTANYEAHPGWSEERKKEKVTRVRFAAGMMGYEGREPVFCWVPNKIFKVVK